MDQDFELIERYIQDVLSPEDKTKVEERLIHDPAFKKEFDAYQSLILAIESKGFQEGLKNRRIPSYSEHKNEKNRSNKYGLLLLAGLIILALIYFTYQFTKAKPVQNSDQIIASVFYPDPGLPTQMGSNSEYSFYDGMVDYKTGDYNRALDKWKSSALSIGKDTLAYYKAMAALRLERFEESWNLLNQIEKNSELHLKSEWRKLELLIHQKKYKEALELLENQPKDIHPNYEKLMEHLREI